MLVALLRVLKVLVNSWETLRLQVQFSTIPFLPVSNYFFICGLSTLVSVLGDPIAKPFTLS